MPNIIWEKPYYYKMFISKWGIAFIITFGYCKNSESIYKDKSKFIENGIYFYDLNNQSDNYCLLLEKDFNYLKYGLKLVSKQIVNHCIYKKDTLILLKEIKYDLCYFQKEALVDAVIRWAAKTFLFLFLRPQITFDKKSNQYLFDFTNIDCNL